MRTRRPTIYATHGLTAAAKLLSDRDIGEKLSKKDFATLEWQKLGWTYYYNIGEIMQAVTLKANTVGKVPIYPAKYTDRNTQPVPLSTRSKADQVALATFNRIPDYSRILRDITIHFSIPGECILIGQPAAAPNYPERWSVHSPEQVKIEKVNGRNKISLRNVPDTNSDLTPLPPDTLYIRLWLQDPRFSQLPSSPIRGILGSAEMILILERAVRSIARNRIAQAGILKYPNELIPNLPIDPASEPNSDGTPKPPKVLLDLLEAMTTPIQNEGSASAIVPLIVNGPSEFLKELEHITFTRPFDDALDIQMQRALRRLAQGLDVPAEFVLGMEGLSHWTAWMVDESMIHTHIEPIIQQVLDSLTEDFFHGQLVESFKSNSISADPYSYCLHYDLSSLIIHPNRTRDTLTAHEAGLISASRAREELGFKETDAPDEVEQLRFLLLKRATTDPIFAATLLNYLYNIEVPGTTPLENEGRGMVNPTSLSISESGTRKLPANHRQPTSPPSTRNDGYNSNITGSVGVEHISTILPNDQFIQGATDLAIRTLIDRIGGRVRSATKRDKPVANSIEHTPDTDVVSVLGPTLASGYNFPCEADVIKMLAPLRTQIANHLTIPDSDPALDSYMNDVYQLSMQSIYIPNSLRPTHITPLSLANSLSNGTVAT